MSPRHRVASLLSSLVGSRSESVKQARYEEGGRYGLYLAGACVYTTGVTEQACLIKKESNYRYLPVTLSGRILFAPRPLRISRLQVGGKSSSTRQSNEQGEPPNRQTCTQVSFRLLLQLFRRFSQKAYDSSSDSCSQKEKKRWSFCITVRQQRAKNACWQYLSLWKAPRENYGCSAKQLSRMSPFFSLSPLSTAGVCYLRDVEGVTVVSLQLLPQPS